MSLPVQFVPQSRCHRFGSCGCCFSSFGLPDSPLRMRIKCRVLSNSFPSGLLTVVLHRHWLILIRWGSLHLPGLLRSPMSLKQLEMWLHPTFWLLFGLVWRLTSATDTSTRWKRIVMQLFLLEVRKRCFAPSILWLHDGFWIDKQVDDGVLVAAERHVRSLLFPLSSEEVPLFRIMDLTEARDCALRTCSRSPFTPLFLASKCSSYLSGSSNRCLISHSSLWLSFHTRRVPSERFLLTSTGLESVPGSFGSEVIAKATRCSASFRLCVVPSDGWHPSHTPLPATACTSIATHCWPALTACDALSFGSAYYERTGWTSSGALWCKSGSLECTRLWSSCLSWPVWRWGCYCLWWSIPPNRPVESWCISLDWEGP